MRCLVTGGLGFIGGAVVMNLLDRNVETVVVDNMSDPSFRFVVPGKRTRRAFSFDYRPMDVREMATNKSLDGEYDVVYHFAGHFANIKSLDEPMENVSVNMLGTMAVLEFCRRNKVPTLVYASSSGVYGAMDVVAYSESSSPRPSTPYEVTKYSGELLCDGYCTIYGMNLVAPRFFNVYGPGDLPGLYRCVIPNFFRLALRGEQIVVTGALASRDFTYVDDVVQAIEAGIKRVNESPARMTIVYNIATGRETLIKNLADMIVGLTKSSSEVKIDKQRDWDNAMRRVGDVHKFRALFPQEADQMRYVDVGLAEALEWYKEVCE